MSICICGKKTRRKKDGKMGKTCGDKRCAGKEAKRHLIETYGLKRGTLFLGKKQYLPYTGDQYGGV